MENFDGVGIGELERSALRKEALFQEQGNFFRSCSCFERGSEESTNPPEELRGGFVLYNVKTIYMQVNAPCNRRRSGASSTGDFDRRCMALDSSSNNFALLVI